MNIRSLSRGGAPAACLLSRSSGSSVDQIASVMSRRNAMISPRKVSLMENDYQHFMNSSTRPSLPFRTKDDPPTGGQGRSHDGKMLIVGAIELGDENIPGRLRLAEISSYGAADLGHFVETAVDPDAIAKTDGWSGDAAVPADRHNVHVVGKTAAHLVLPWIHQVFSNLKGWA